nr:MAG TPA: hypothetical protein [Caudoviricetes sp.]
MELCNGIGLHLIWFPVRQMFLSFNKPSQVHNDSRGVFKEHKVKRHNNIQTNSVEHTTVTKKPSGWQKYDSPSYEKLPSGKHNTINILLTRCIPGYVECTLVEN